MFEKRKYQKMKQVESKMGLSELKILLDFSVDKTCFKNLTNKIKEYFGNYKIEKTTCFEIYTLAEEYPLEIRLGEIMELIALCKTGEEIEFFVNEQSYKI